VTTPRDDGDVVVPLQLQPVVARPQGWRGRSSSLVGVGLVAFVVVALVLGNAFDDGRPSGPGPAIAVVPSASPTVRPSARPTATPEPLATPLPARDVRGGQIPTEQRLVYANGIELLDLATGVLTQLPAPIDEAWALLPLPNGQFVCACVARDPAANAGPGSAILRFVRFDQAGLPVVELDLQSFDEAVAVPNMDEGFNVAAALDPEGRSLYLLVVERRPPVWIITLRMVDVETGGSVATIDVDQIPIDPDGPGASATPSASPSAPPRNADSPPDGTYIWGSSIAVAPGERSAFVTADRSDIEDGNGTWRPLEWLVSLEPGTGEAAPLQGTAALEPESSCFDAPTFVDAALLVRVCAAPFGGTLAVRRIAVDGTSVGDIPIVSAGVEGSSPWSVVVDRSRRAVFLWDAQRHALSRVGLDDGAVTEVAVPEPMLPDAGRLAGGRGYVVGNPSLVRSADGRFLYAIGVAGVVGGSVGRPSGIWVFDATSLELVDHWEALAFLSSLALSADGRFIYAIGAPGYDVTGRENPWPASVTVYDAATGDVQVVYGAVARDTWINFVPTF